jgi:hypothetical protein
MSDTEHKSTIQTRNEQADAARYEMIERMVNGTEDGISIATGYYVTNPTEVVYWVRAEDASWEAEAPTLSEAVLRAYDAWEESRG